MLHAFVGFAFDEEGAGSQLGGRRLTRFGVGRQLSDRTLEVVRRLAVVTDGEMSTEKNYNRQQNGQTTARRGHFSEGAFIMRIFDMFSFSKASVFSVAHLSWSTTRRSRWCGEALKRSSPFSALSAHSAQRSGGLWW